jgi:hypothetical protein
MARKTPTTLEGLAARNAELEAAVDAADPKSEERAKLQAELHDIRGLYRTAAREAGLRTGLVVHAPGSE